MIQIHGNTILSMGFNPKIKAHGSNSWQYYLINGIQSHSQCPWFKPMANYLSKSPISISNIKSPIFIGNIKSLVLVGNIKKAQFPLTTSNAQFLLAISKAQFMLALFYQKPKIINAWQKISCWLTLFLKHYYGKNHGNRFIKAHGKLSWRLCSHIINPWNTWSSFTSQHP